MNNEKNWLEILRLANEAVKDYDCEIIVEEDKGNGMYNVLIEDRRQLITTPYKEDDSSREDFWADELAKTIEDCKFCIIENYEKIA